MMMAVLVLYSLETLQAPAAAHGLLITAYAAGSLFGAGISAKLEVLLGTPIAAADGLQRTCDVPPAAASLGGGDVCA
jgi:hypothetical protein